MTEPKSFAKELAEIAVKKREMSSVHFRLWRDLCRSAAHKGKYSCVLLKRRYVVAHYASTWNQDRLLRDFAETIALLKKQGIKISAEQQRCKCRTNDQKARHPIHLVASWPEI